MNDLVVVFTSVLSSGVVAALISASLTEAKERWVFRPSKIEEIYLNTTAWLKVVNTYFLRYITLCTGSTYDQVLDMELKAADNSTGDWHLKMKMNIEMYEQSLIPALRLVEQELRKLNEIRLALKECYAKTGQAAEFLTPLNNQILAFGRVSDALMAAVVERGVEIGAERGQAARAYEWASVKICSFVQRIRRLIAKGRYHS